MGITHNDLNMLHGSMANLGNTFRQRRMDEEEQRQRQIQRDLLDRQMQMRERGLGIQEQRATTAEEANSIRAQATTAGKITATLEGDDGGQITYSGPPEGYQSLLENSQKIARPLRPAQPKATPYSITLARDDGEVTLRARTLEELEEAVKQIKTNHTVGKPSNMPSEWSDRDPNKYYVNKNGAVIPPDKSNKPALLDPFDKSELNTAYRELQDINKQLLDSTLGPPAKSELQKRKLDLTIQIEGMRKRVRGESSHVPVAGNLRVAEARIAEEEAPQAAADDVLPMPKSKEQMVKGRKYQTGRGVATWDGTQFVK